MQVASSCHHEPEDGVNSCRAKLGATVLLQHWLLIPSCLCMPSALLKSGFMVCPVVVGNAHFVMYNAQESSGWRLAPRWSFHCMPA